MSEPWRSSAPGMVDPYHQDPSSPSSASGLGPDYNKLSSEEYSCPGRDSGFLSGPCTTESDLCQMSTSDLGSSMTASSHSTSGLIPHHKPSASNASNITTSSSKSMSISGYSRLDSGVDVSVSESLSGLNISEHDELDQEDDDQCHPSQAPSSSNNLTKGMPPWEFFFTPDEDGDTQLHIGIMEGNEEFVYSLISMVPHPSILDFQNNLAQTSLHVAVLCGQARIVRRLVAAGARVDMRDRNGNTPLHLSASSGDLASLQALSFALSSQEIHQCALRYPPFAQKLPQQIDLTNYHGQGPIHLAAMGGHSDVIRALHWLGTQINAKEGKGGRTALHYVVERGHLKALKVLVEECGADLEEENYAGLTAYQLASGASESSPLAKELKNLGATPLDLPMDEDSSSEEEEEDNETSLNNSQLRNNNKLPHSP